MKNILPKLIRAALTLVAAVALTLGSAYVERMGPEQVQYGNLCGAAGSDPCYQPALKGGFPFAYLVDAPGVSVERQLSFGEDTLHEGALVADIASYFAILMLIYYRGRFAALVA